MHLKPHPSHLCSWMIYFKPEVFLASQSRQILAAMVGFVFRGTASYQSMSEHCEKYFLVIEAFYSFAQNQPTKQDVETDNDINT